VFYITVVLLIIYGSLISYYGSWWKNIPVFKPDRYPAPSVPITIIIPARDEAGRIGECLRSLLLQSYPAQFRQIIVVNDHSSDNTAALVQEFAQAGVQLINLEDHVKGVINSYKKKAIEVAISKATGQLIVTSDADCTFPPHW